MAYGLKASSCDPLNPLYCFGNPFRYVLTLVYGGCIVVYALLLCLSVLVYLTIQIHEFTKPSYTTAIYKFVLVYVALGETSI